MVLQTKLRLFLKSLVNPTRRRVGHPAGLIRYALKHRAELQIFSRWVGQSDPWSKKYWVIFGNDGPKHIKLNTVDIWVVYFTSDTDTCMHISIWTADYTVKPVLSGHSKKKDQLSLNAGQKYCILQSFWPSLSYHLLLRSIFCSFLSGCLRQVLPYWQPTCTFCFVEFVDRCKMTIFFLLKWDYFTTKKDGSTEPTALESDGPYFEIMGQWPGPTINLKAWSGFESPEKNWRSPLQAVLWWLVGCLNCFSCIFFTMA